MLGQWLANITRKLNNNFYIYLATLFSVVVLLDASTFGVGLNMRDKAFDFMVKYRVFVPAADKNIVIVDINEASLAAFSKEYGRWPWPRQVMGEFVENIQAQKPKAIVFDIVFSDADIYNPDSDAYFNDVIAASDNTFFPILRLDPSQDHLSQITPTMIPGIKRSNKNEVENKQTNKPIAIILPFFKGALKADRLGTHNVYPDNDGVVREYRMFHDESGWRLPALPNILADYSGANIAKIPEDMLLNWRGKPFTYTYASFSDVFTDLASQNKKRPQDEFTNKIVIIGSTAPGLFDIKPTAMDKQFPGVEILATAIDNAKHGDYLKVWRGQTPYVLLSLLLIWLTTFAFYMKVDRDKFNTIFTSSQIGLLVLSYAAINLSNTYLDLTAPILWAVAYFSIAKIYALATDRALQRWLAFGVRSDTPENGVLIMPIIIDSKEALSDALLKKLKRKIELASITPNTIEILQGIQSGIWGLFGDMVVVSWIYALNKPEYAQAALQDATQLGEALPNLILELGLPITTNTRYITHENKLVNIETMSLASQWRLIFAQSILKLEHPDIHKTNTQETNTQETKTQETSILQTDA